LSASDIKTGNGKIFLENLNCLGNEMDVETCTFTNWENNHCTHSNDVGIDCGKYLKYIFKHNLTFVNIGMINGSKL
jgi:hypothetical protein